MASDLSTLDSLTKNVYLPGLPNWVNQRRPIFGRLEKITKKQRFRGRKFIFAAQDALPQGGGAIGEGEDLPAAGNSSVVNMELAMKYHYYTARLSAQVMDAASSDVGAFADAVKTELNGIRSQLEEDLAVNGLFGDGSGAIAEVADYQGTTLTLKSQPTVAQNGTRNLRKNMYVQSWAAKTGGSVRADHKLISAITSGTQATVPGSAGFQVGDYLFRSVGVAATSDPRNKVIMGLRGIVDSSTYVSTFQNQPRATNPGLQANILGNGGALRAWSPDLMDEAAMEGVLNGGGKSPSAIYSPLEIQRRAASYLRADRQFDMSVKTLDGGYKAVTWTTPERQIPWFWDRFCIPNRVDFVCEEDLFLAIQQDISFADNDGRTWRYTDRKDAVEAWLRTWRNLGARACNNHTSLQDISHTA
jgi:hypothetical protein